jgi:tetratricopeptide (TPR) repeat protein
MNRLTIATWASAACLILLNTSPALADLDSDILMLQQRWAEVNYQLDGKAQITAFEILIDDATKATTQYPEDAPAWVWSGIIKSTYAGAKGGLGALKIAKSSKADLEKAMKIEPEAMQGSAYTSLGTLYFNVPGWPVGFGDDKKAEKFLLKAISINPDGIDSNYFYGDYLKNEKRYHEAESFYLKAQSAPARSDRPLADAGRQEEIALALLGVRKELGK